MKKISAIIIIFLLSGCMTPEQIAAQEREIEQRKADYCASLGAPPGSPNYYDCRLRVEQQLAYEQAQKRAYFAEIDRQDAQRNAAMMNAFGYGNNVRCTSERRFDKVYTNCR